MKQMMKNALMLAMVIGLATLFSCSSDDDDKDTNSAVEKLVGDYTGTLNPGRVDIIVNISAAGDDKVNITFVGKGKMPAPVQGMSARWADATTVQVVSPMVMYYTETGKIQISEYIGTVYQFNGQRQ